MWEKFIAHNFAKKTPSLDQRMFSHQLQFCEDLQKMMRAGLLSMMMRMMMMMSMLLVSLVSSSSAENIPAGTIISAQSTRYSTLKARAQQSVILVGKILAKL